jgi:saccharopine dehydrogenase-like NADP-dependent oxidoreductase
VAGQTRNELPDVNTKNLITNYIENGSWDIIPDMSGSADYITDGGNEIMYCIQDGLGTVSC